MLEILFDVLLAAVATWQAVETWHHGSLFSKPRKWLHQEARSIPAANWTPDMAWIKFAELMTCPFCLSHWVGAGLFLLLWLHEPESLWCLPVYCLAGIRLAQLLNDLLYPWCRSPAEVPDEERELNLEEEEAPDERSA